MRHAIIADVHANAIALRSALGELSAAKTDSIHCLGDLVGYHAQPREAIAIVRDTKLPSVAGNHDRMALSSEPPTGGPLARAAMQWTRRVLDQASVDWLAALPLERRIGDDVLLTHSVPWSTEIRLKADQDFAAAAEQLRRSHPWAEICFTGHTHVALSARVAPDGSVTMHAPVPTTLDRSGGIWFVNPGSIGLPRDGAAGARYAVYDDVSRNVTFHVAPYDMEAINLANRGCGLATRVPEAVRVATPTPVAGIRGIGSFRATP